MKNDNLESLFEDLKGEFNIETPQPNHELRFLDKLNAKDNVLTEGKKTLHFNWKPLLAIAAAIVICFGLFTMVDPQPKVLDLASVSPEMSETQNFFTVTLENELKKLNKERSPLTEQIINDALIQIQLLETDYQKLKTDLTESGKNERVIYAMISNFQTRIDILNNVLEQIETVKQFKSNSNETII
ncbi:hypothetical protein [Winogradskyella sediminis]|uniref:DUF4179 domain-containing protein n=1 Tax=Winogradskyella sediminis TaxID=1382466 RepID=A0A1H1M4D8_9FLAO|nr:hypothetical protein [Winogradskyella sediminis]REG85977.1 hypothetical protein C8N41_10373 [Winogradskyella sediminis]SDR81265.1 hypothetical protein SAMN04489797_0190 [Winogradskyella sediminis]